jgi:hypothetical protein
MLIFGASPALAVEQPSTIDISDVTAYRHVLEDNDMLVIVTYNLQYTTNPDDSVEYTYLGRMMNGNTTLSTVVPYSYHNSGYDWGIFSFYFSAADAPAWEGSYVVRLEGNPTLSWTDGTPPLVATSTISWNSATTQAATEYFIEQKVLYLADDLSDRWQVTLTEQVTGGTVLSSAGEQYFTNSISNLRTIAPDIFSTAVITPVFTEETHTTTYRDVLLSRVNDTIVGRPRDSLASLLGVGSDIAGAILFFAIIGVLIWGIMYSSGGQTRPIAFILVPMVILGNIVGLLTLTFTVVIGLLSILASGYILFYRGASV